MQLFKRVLLPFLWGKGTFSVPSKGERQFACLRKGLFDNELRDNYKGLYSFDKISQYLLRTVIRNFVPRTFKRLTNLSSPL